MPEFLTTLGVSFQIENIILEAQNELILVSPYLQLSKIFCERLLDASNKNVTIKIVYGKSELNSKHKSFLTNLKNVNLFYLENLHAKCYLNENKMVLTSMNMYEFSEKNNREMGILIEKKNDSELYKKAVTEALSIITHSKEMTFKNENLVYFQGKNDNIVNWNINDISVDLKVKLNGLTLADAEEDELIIPEKFQLLEKENHERIVLLTNHGEILLNESLTADMLEKYCSDYGLYNLVFRANKYNDGKINLILTTI